MFETRSVVLQGSIVSAALLLAGSGCTGDTGAKGDKGDPGAQGSAGSQGSQGSAGTAPTTPDPAAAFTTATPIKHVVIIFGENVSFDHYFATYPTALNLARETPFVAAAGTPKANNLSTPLDVSNNFVPLTGVNLLASNPNKQNAQNTADGSTAVDPPRLTPKQASTADQNHAYGAEQASVNAGNGGAMDLFPSTVGVANPTALTPQVGKWLVMGYYDGNTVTALWNYAQRFAMNDNSWTTQFGPSSPGAINLISGQTNGATNVIAPNPATVGNTVADDGHGGFTVIGDPQPNGDVCSDPASRVQVSMTGKNIGDLLNEKNITWGAFMGGFDLTIVNPNGSFGCNRITSPTQQPFAGSASPDYIPHHMWFQYYASTANLMHLRPSSLSAIGSSKAADGSAEPANHNYDSHDFFDALAIGNLPAVSFVKAPAYQDGHGGYSNPIDEQSFIISVVNSLQKSPFWGTTAVIIAYDDSDGWYDHQAPPIVSTSSITPTATVQGDLLNGPGVCTGAGAQQGKTAATLLGAAGTTAVNGRCGYGTRVPLLVVSPFARKNFIDHTLTDQTSVLKFIEDNWLAGKRIQPNGSFDTIAGPINGMFDFSHPMPVVASNTLWLDPSNGLEVDAAQIEAAELEK
jgi:phospholipase C